MKIGILRESMHLVWMSIKSCIQLMYGYYRISRLNQPVITIFGGKWVKPNSVYAQQAFQLGRKCAEYNMAVLTGGGPGAMEAAQCGAATDPALHKKQALGIAVSGVDEGFATYCHAPCIKVDHLFVRKWLLIRYSAVYVIFPGGIGTVDELFEIFNEIKLKKHGGLIIIFGKAYWQSLLDWFDHAIQEGLVRPEFRSVFVVADDVDYAFEIIMNAIKKYR